MNKLDVKEIVNAEIKKFVDDSLDKEMKKILSRSSSQSRQEIIDAIKNSLDSVYKVLWQKKDFWKTDIK